MVSVEKSPAWFEKTLEDIRSLKVQGAEEIARAGVVAAARLVAERRDVDAGVKALLATRPTEPMLRNALAAFRRAVKLSTPVEAARKVLRHLDDADGRIAAYAADLITPGHFYYTHCHSGTVVKAFLEARALGAKFAVRNTETRPLYQGRKTAAELAAAGIPVVHVVDSAARVALKGCAAVFFGADALLADGTVVNKIGSEMVAELARNRSIPVYVLANSWKYDARDASAFKTSLEHRDPAEVWDSPPKGVRVVNEAFELVNPKLITGIITEYGVRDPRSAILEIQRHHSWLADDG